MGELGLDGGGSVKPKSLADENTNVATQVRDKIWRVSKMWRFSRHERHPGLDPGSPNIALLRGLRVKPAMTD